VVRLAEKSNVGFPGKWIFRIDEGADRVEKDICKTKGKNSW
jgi:hypothetical protein